jgi:hypothetical protein
MPEIVQGRVARIARLHQRLAGAREPDSHDLVVGSSRAVAYRQLFALVEYAESDPICAGTIPEMHRLLASLIDLENGKRIPWLLPKRKAGGTPIPTYDAYWRGRYAAVMEWLMSPCPNGRAGCCAICGDTRQSRIAPYKAE